MRVINDCFDHKLLLFLESYHAAITQESSLPCLSYLIDVVKFSSQNRRRQSKQLGSKKVLLSAHTLF